MVMKQCEISKENGTENISSSKNAEVWSLMNVAKALEASGVS